MIPKLQTLSGLPKWVIPVVVTSTAAALLPIVIIANARSTFSGVPRIELIQNMDNQPRFKAQQPNAMFADGRAMRPIVAGTVARGELLEDEFLNTGIEHGQWATRLPMPLSAELMHRGRERYDIYCAPCHGLSGTGDGLVARRADQLAEGTWTPPASLHTDLVRSRQDGYLFNVITNGIRTMPAYGSQVPTNDRWAIVAYVRALQRSVHATLGDLPPGQQSQLR
jgi:mono/diheme cytochrome c family protein